MSVLLICLVLLPSRAEAPPTSLGVANHRNFDVATIEPVPRGVVDGRAGGHPQRMLAAQRRFATGKVIVPGDGK